MGTATGARKRGCTTRARASRTRKRWPGGPDFASCVLEGAPEAYLAAGAELAGRLQREEAARKEREAAQILGQFPPLPAGWPAALIALTGALVLIGGV